MHDSESIDSACQELLWTDFQANTADVRLTYECTKQREQARVRDFGLEKIAHTINEYGAWAGPVKGPLRVFQVLSEDQNLARRDDF
jgi:hypothetical protein